MRYSGDLQLCWTLRAGKSPLEYNVLSKDLGDPKQYYRTVIIWGPRTVSIWGPRTVSIWGPRTVSIWGPRTVSIWGPRTVSIWDLESVSEVFHCLKSSLLECCLEVF